MNDDWKTQGERSIAEWGALGGDDFVVQMLRSFVDWAPGKLEEAKRAQATDDLKTLSEAAHALKSSVGHFGWEELREQSGRIQKAGERGDFNAVTSETQDWVQAMEEVLEWGRQSLKRYTTGSP